MQIQFNTDHTIDGTEALAAHVKNMVGGALDRFSGHITRLEIHLGDENGERSGMLDKRCMIEARLEGRRPTAVTHHAATVEDPVRGAAGKLERLLETSVERTREHRPHCMRSSRNPSWLKAPICVRLSVRLVARGAA